MNAKALLSRMQSINSHCSRSSQKVQRFRGIQYRTNRIVARFTATDKYCKDCIHFIEDTNYPIGSPEAKRYGFCTLFTVRDIVSGEDRYVHARTIRMKDIPGVPTCGIKANFYEAKVAVVSAWQLE